MAEESKTKKTATAKAPQDHKPKTETPKVDTVEIDVDNGDGSTRKAKARRVSLRGVVVTVPDDALDDFEVLDDVRAVQDDGDASRLPALLRRLVGADDYRRVMTALRGPSGRVTVEDGSSFVLELFQAIGGQGN